MKLHDYQRVGVEHLQRNPQAGLFMQMGIRYGIPMITKCAKCGVQFNAGRGSPKFCSDRCRLNVAECAQCHEEFWYRNNRNGYVPTYCSQSCRLAAMSIRNRTTQRVNKPGGLTTAEKDKIRQKRVQSRRGTGYLALNGEHVHRAVAAAILGRPLLPSEVVHHEDRNQMNNDPANLIVFESQAEHARHHGLEHRDEPCACKGIRLKEVMA